MLTSGIVRQLPVKQQQRNNKIRQEKKINFSIFVNISFKAFTKKIQLNLIN